MENFNYKGYRAANILKAFQQDIQKGGVGSGRHPLHKNYDIKFHDDETPLYKDRYTGKTDRRNLIATHRKTGEQHILGVHRRSTEGYSSNPNKSRLHDKSRKVNHFNWNPEGIRKVIHPDVTIGSDRYGVGSSYSPKDLQHDTARRTEYNAKEMKEKLEQVYDKYHKKED